MNTTNKNNLLALSGYALSESNSDFLFTTWEKKNVDGHTLLTQDNLTSTFYVTFTPADSDTSLRHESVPTLSKALKSAVDMASQARTYRHSSK